MTTLLLSLGPCSGVRSEMEDARSTVQGLGVRVLGFRGLGVEGLGRRVKDLGVLGFRGLGFRV